MNILCIEPFLNSFSSGKFPKSKEPNIALLRVINLLREQHTVKFLDFKIDAINKASFMDIAVSFSPEICFIDTKTYNRYFARKLAHMIRAKNPGCTIICFGQHASYDPSFFLRDGIADAVIKDEIYPFFFAFMKLTSPLKKLHELPNTIVLKDGKEKNSKLQGQEITDLDSLPLLSIPELLSRDYYTLYPMKTLGVQRWGFLNLTKGCPYACVFCSPTLRITHGKACYHCSVDNAMHRITRLLDAGCTSIRFVDDEFFFDAEFIKELCQEIIRRKLRFRWMAQVRADSVRDDVLAVARKAGCECLNIGVETGSQRIMDLLAKQESVSDMKRCFALCKKHKILTVAYFMIGNPGETKQDLLKTRKLMDRISPTMIQIAFFTPYPGSIYYASLSDREKASADFFHYSNMVHNFSRMKTAYLRSVMKQWYALFYLHPIRFLRLMRYRMFFLPWNLKRELRIMGTLLRFLFS